MEPDTIKWLIAIPGSIAATVSLPLLVRKQVLECKKLDLEISEKEIILQKLGKPYREVRKNKNGKAIATMEWLGTWGVFWQMIVLANSVTFGLLFKSFVLFFVGAAISTVLGLICVYCSVEAPRKRWIHSLEDLKDTMSGTADPPK